MLVRDVMRRPVKVARPDQSVSEAAAIMEEAEVGCLPVVENGTPVGMLSDRDVAARAGASGETAGFAPVGDVMTEEFVYCHDDDDMDAILGIMFDRNIRRMPVLTRRSHRLVGIVSVDDLAAKALDNKFAGMIVAAAAPAPVPGAPA